MVEPALFKSISPFYLGFEMVFITEEFTRYQMWYHYTWVVVTLLFMFLPRLGFFYEMHRLHQNFWSRQQVEQDSGSGCVTGRRLLSGVRFVCLRASIVVSSCRRTCADVHTKQVVVEYDYCPQGAVTLEPDSRAFPQRSAWVRYW